uniref:Uncharacterized protein n=1 Tax=Triticum urartu TaxID=4572 RepID=A0A8R7QCZ4_TRIUA
TTCSVGGNGDSFWPDRGAEASRNSPSSGEENTFRYTHHYNLFYCYIGLGLQNLRSQDSWVLFLKKLLSPRWINLCSPHV